uniref:Uncharacterized protein n=1 Tax=Arundo donax TaxID=35708 RepID=A0A0A8YK82_ARUDO
MTRRGGAGPRWWGRAGQDGGGSVAAGRSGSGVVADKRPWQWGRAE